MPVPFAQFVPTSVADAPVNNRRVILEDDTTVIYPKLPSGKTIRVLIVRRKVTLYTPGFKPTVFHAVMNAKKWSYRIDYAYKPKTTRMTKEAMLSALGSMGLTQEALDGATNHLLNG